MDRRVSREASRRRQRVIATCLAAVLLLMALAPAAALARAGGGQVGGGSSSSGGSSGSHSSGGFSSGSSSSGGSGGPIGPVGIAFMIFLPVFIVGLFFAIFGWTWYQGGKAYKAKQAAEAALGEKLATLSADDPDFTADAFYDRVREMFMAIQTAWAARDMRPARRFLSSQQYAVLDQGVQELIRNGRLNKLEAMNIDAITPVSVEREGGLDVVKLRITATCVDYTVDEHTGEIVNPLELGDGKTAAQFEEIWTVVRKVGAHSKTTVPLSACPNCGAPVKDDDDIVCAYCGTQMNDPALDWVLMRIEQVG